jgi:hypothetical protein
MGFHPTQITWFGYSVFASTLPAMLCRSIRSSRAIQPSPQGGRDQRRDPDRATHGHSDHVGDTFDIAKTNGATVTPTMNSACG